MTPTLHATNTTTLPLRRSLGVSFLWTLAGNVTYAASQWLIVVLLARLGDPSAVGYYALGLAIASPLITLTSLQLRTVLATQTGDHFRFAHCFALRLVGTVLFALAVAAVALAGHYDSTGLTVLAAVALVKAAESLSDVGYGVMQSHERMDRIAKLQILKASASLAAMLTAIIVTGSPVAGIVALAAVYTLTLAFDYRTVRLELPSSDWKPDWDRDRLLELFKLSVPLGSSLLLASLNANIPRYVLEHFRGVHDVGVFSAVAYIAVSANLLVMAFGQAVAPRMARAFEHDLARYRTLSQRLMLLAAGVGVFGLTAAIAAGPAILGLLYGPEYAGENRVFVWLMMSGILSFSASAAGFSLTSARYFRVQVPVLLLVAIVTAGACYLLVPEMGVLGAALGQACGYAVQLTCSFSYLLLILWRGAPARGSLIPVLEMVFKREV